jgi:hypothetical protein
MKLVSGEANKETVDPAGNAPEQLEVELFEMQSIRKEESNTLPPGVRLFC